MARPAKPWFRSADGGWWTTLKGKKVSLGVYGPANESQAWAAFHRLRGSSGEPPTPPVPPEPPPPPPPKEVTVRDVILAFLTDSNQRVEPKTMYLYRHFLERFDREYGDRPVHELTRTEAESYSRKPEWSTSTQSSFLAVLIRAFRFAVYTNLIDRSPLANLKRPPITSRSADVMISADEYRSIYAAATPVFRPFLQFVWLTGCRPGEAAQLTADDIDWAVSRATIRNHKTMKLGKKRRLHLPPDALILLREIATERPTGPLFRNRLGHGWEWTAWGYAMRKASEKAGLETKTMYGLRHTFATDALAEGLPDAVVSELLGHASTQMLHKHYSHLSTKTTLLVNAASKVRGTVEEGTNAQPTVVIPVKNVMWAETLGW